MVATETIQIPLGFKAPDFTLPDVISKKQKSINELKGEKGTVVMFICNHCPYVKHIINGIVQVANEYIPKSISFIAINSNDIVNYPDDSPEKMIEFAKKHKFPFPYLFDESQEIAKKYKAACTPDFNVFDKNLICVYRGQFDDARPGNNVEVTGNDLKKVLEALINNTEIPKYQKPSIGCSIKWKKR